MRRTIQIMGCAPHELEWIREHMEEIIDATDAAFAVQADGDMPLVWFEQVAAQFDLTPPVIEDPAPWEWDTDPPLGVLVREIAQRLHPGEDVTGWLYTQQQLAWYIQDRDFVDQHREDLEESLAQMRTGEGVDVDPDELRADVLDVQGAADCGEVQPS